MSDAVPPGRPGSLDAQQQKALESLKTELLKQSVYPDEASLRDDAFLCRFLRARDWNVGKATTMLKNCEKWRKEFKVDELYASWNMPDEERHAILSAWPQYFHRTDREGRPMYIQQCNVTPEALFSAANETRLIEYFAMTFESVIRHRYAACAEASGRYIDSTFIVFSMQDVSLKNFWTIRNFIIKLAQYSQDYFPETSGKIRIINAGMLFSSMYASLTPFLAKVTTDKIKIYGTDFADKLFTEVDPANFPKHLGGQCECEGSCLFAEEGPWKGKEDMGRRGGTTS